MHNSATLDSNMRRKVLYDNFLWLSVNLNVDRISAICLMLERYPGDRNGVVVFDHMVLKDRNWYLIDIIRDVKSWVHKYYQTEVHYVRIYELFGTRTTGGYQKLPHYMGCQNDIDMK